MKRMSRLACGIVVSFMLVTGQDAAQAQTKDFSLHASARDAAPSQQELAHARDFTPPAPRGDLRGDIASNARARPDNDHDDKTHRH
jgi:hypothetical protein